MTRIISTAPSIQPSSRDEVTHSAQHAAEVREVTEVRVRWVGHRLLADANIAVKSDFSVEQGHEITRAMRHELLHHLPYLGNAMSILPCPQVKSIIGWPTMSMTICRPIHIRRLKRGQRHMPEWQDDRSNW